MVEVTGISNSLKTKKIQNRYQYQFENEKNIQNRYQYQFEYSIMIQNRYQYQFEYERITQNIYQVPFKLQDRPGTRYQFALPVCSTYPVISSI